MDALKIFNKNYQKFNQQIFYDSLSELSQWLLKEIFAIWRSRKDENIVLGIQSLLEKVKGSLLDQ